MLIIFGGLPAVGKTGLAKELAKNIGAFYIRADTIEQAMRDCTLKLTQIDDAGYAVGYALAYENLTIGNSIVADCVNPLKITRDDWFNVGKKANSQILEIEVICSDIDEHKKRVENRSNDIKSLVLPTWQDVINREYQPWHREHIIIDTAGKTIHQSFAEIKNKVKLRQLTQAVSL